MDKGIDLSYHNGVVDFAKVKRAGISFVILRIGYRGWGDGSLQKDTRFEEYYAKAKANGLKVGGYFFSQAINYNEGKAECEFCLKILGTRTLDYPLYIDTEHSGASNNKGRADLISNADRTAAIKGFCEYGENNGWYVGIYASPAWFASRLNYKELMRYDKWIAKWSIFPPPTTYGDFGLWQNSNNGSINGISGRVDLNNGYKRYPYIMEQNGLNNYGVPVKYNITAKYLTSEQADKVQELCKTLDVVYDVTKV